LRQDAPDAQCFVEAVERIDRIGTGRSAEQHVSGLVEAPRQLPQPDLGGGLAQVHVDADGQRLLVARQGVAPAAGPVQIPETGQHVRDAERPIVAVGLLLMVLDPDAPGLLEERARFGRGLVAAEVAHLLQAGCQVERDLTVLREPLRQGAAVAQALLCSLDRLELV
jgi:hypothetical protein